MKTKQILLFDGIRYSVQTIDLTFHRLERGLNTIAALPDDDDTDLSAYIVEAMADAWTFVDAVHRLRRLLQNTPRLKQNVPEVQLFLRSSQDFEELRNFVQHFPTEIHEFVNRQMPLWGTVSWTFTDEASGLPGAHTITPGTFFHGAQIHSPVFDTWKGEFVGRIMLNAGPATVDLAKMYERTERFWNWFEEIWGRAFSEFDKHHGADMKMQFLIALHQTPTEPA